MLVVLCASVLVHFAPLWLEVPAAILLFVVFALVARSGPRPPEPPARIGLVRGLFLVWLAVAVAATVLVALGGFYREDLALLAVVWAILVALWSLDRILPRARSVLTKG